MQVTLPSPQNPERWLLIATLAILVGLAVFVAWPKPERLVTTEGVSVSLSKHKTKTLLQQAKSSKQQADASIARTAPIHAQAQVQHFFTHHLKPTHALPVSADSVHVLRDSLQRSLTNL